MAKEKFNEEDGVWRTIGGRRVFIKKGQSLSDAMKESGKFKTGKKEEVKDHTFEMDEEDKKKYEEVGKKIDDLTKEIDEEKSKGDKINETMDKRQAVIEKLDKETEDLSDYDRYNLAVSKLEDTEGMTPTEKQYWAGVRDNYQKNALGKQMKDAEKEKENNSNWNDEKYKNTYNKMSKEEQDKIKGLEDDMKKNPSSANINEKQKEAQDLYSKYNKQDAGDNKDNLNYRDKITDVAKNSKEDNVTLDIETGKPVSFEKGYSVSFQQSTDDYSDEEYAEKVRECSEKCDGKVYAGKYGGDAEVSFHTDSLDDAKEIMYKYNQESIWDWQHETLIMNDKYDASKNQTNYNAEEKSSNDIMNNAIREKAGKNKVKEDLPQRTEIKTQGTSNRKEVSENIQAHILDYYESPDDFISQMDNMNAPTMWHAGEQLAKGGSYMIYYDDQREFLDSLKINPKGKRFNDDRVFSTYTSLIGRESAKLYDRLQRNAYKKYLKEHPGSEMSLDDFKKMRKGE